jgi:hypothetical protein
VSFSEGMERVSVFVGMELNGFNDFIEGFASFAFTSHGERLAGWGGYQQPVGAVLFLVLLGGELEPVPDIVVDRLHAIGFTGGYRFGHYFHACFFDA